MCQLGKLHFTVICIMYENNRQTDNANHRFAFTDLQQLLPRWHATSPTGPNTDLGLGNTCLKMWIPSCAPIWFMLSPSSTTKTSWLPMNGMMRPCTRLSMAWRASKNLSVHSMKSPVCLHDQLKCEVYLYIQTLCDKPTNKLFQFKYSATCKSYQTTFMF